MSDMQKSHIPWDGEQGRIDQQMLAKYLAGITSAIYYVTGPPGMVKGLRTLLKATGIDADDVRTEEFTTTELRPVACLAEVSESMANGGNTMPGLPPPSNRTKMTVPVVFLSQLKAPP